jgi:hypothetical protein
VGRPAPTAPERRARRAPSYDRALATLTGDRGETVFLEELECY